MTKILEQAGPLKAECVDLDEALGRIVAKDVYAGIPLLPFDQAAVGLLAEKSCLRHEL